VSTVANQADSHSKQHFRNLPAAPTSVIRFGIAVSIQGASVTEEIDRVVEFGLDQDLDPTTVEQLGAKRLAELIVRETYRNAGVGQALRLAVASLQSADAFADVLARECQMIGHDDDFYDYRKARILVAMLERVAEAIYDDLLPRSPRRAAELLADVIQLDGHAIEHSDDHDYEIAEVVEECVVAVGRAWAAVADRDVAELAARILALITTDAYGMRRGLFGACRDALGPEGLDVLEQMAQSALRASPEHSNRLAHALQAIGAARERSKGQADDATESP
jgi:hypothetical protein